MKIPKVPDNEKERLKALEEFKIIDSLPEKEYDEITYLASYICNTPIALISLIDEKKQFFKSRVGLEISETSRDYAFCAHAINSPNEETIVNDSRQDDRFSDNPLVLSDPGIVFYAGMPLVTSEGFALGTLCVIDNKPRRLSKEQMTALKALSNQVVKLLELRKTNALLEESKKKLENYALQMEEFAYGASHDLKEPARMVKSFMEILQNDYAEKLDENAQKFIYFAVDGAQRMTLLIDELLAYSKIDHLGTEKEEVDVHALVQEVLDFQRNVLEEKGAKVNLKKLPVVYSSSTALKIVFQNLIGNALKYQRQGVNSIIEINSNDLGKYWEFSIEDNGIGIEAEYFEQIFKIFKRLHSRQEYAGIGMGLAICKKIVESLGGKIRVASEGRNGSIFYFTILKET